MQKKMTSKNMDFIIQSYINVISLCREAKQYGIEIHKVRKVHETGNILAKYNISGSELTAIYDDRIPKEFKIDAVDNMELVYTIEEERIKK